MDSNMASNGPCFMVSWTVFKNHLLEVGLTQNRWETMALRTVISVDFFNVVLCARTHMNRYSLK